MKLLKGMMPKISKSSMTGFKKSDFTLGVGLKKKKRVSIKSMLRKV